MEVKWKNDNEPDTDIINSPYYGCQNMVVKAFRMDIYS